MKRVLASCPTCLAAVPWSWRALSIRDCESTPTPRGERKGQVMQRTYRPQRGRGVPPPKPKGQSPKVPKSSSHPLFLSPIRKALNAAREEREREGDGSSFQMGPAFENGPHNGPFSHNHFSL